MPHFSVVKTALNREDVPKGLARFYHCTPVRMLADAGRVEGYDCISEWFSVLDRTGWEGGGGTDWLLAFVISLLTRHPFREGAPFLLRIETPPTAGRSSRCFHILHGNILLVLSPSWFAACGHRLSPGNSDRLLATV